MTYIKIKNSTEKEEVALFPLKMISLVLLGIGILLFNLMLLNDTNLNKPHHADVVDNNIHMYQEITITP
ncbi:MAG: hypothetical protein ACPG5B_04865 [Chitinophagales bacterium]